jgi:hypothetical protein
MSNLPLPLPKSGSGYQVADGNKNEVTFFGRAQAVAITAAYTLTMDDFASALLDVTSSGSYSITTPTAVLLDAGLVNAKIGASFILFICHETVTNVITLVGGAGVTVVGLATVTGITSGQFMFRKTGDGAWSAYRVA